MPYKKYKKPAFKSNRIQNYGNGYKQLKHDIMLLKQLINVEKKFIDASSSPSVSSTGAVTLISGTAQGTDITNRVGDSIKYSQMQAEGNITLNGSATNDYVRCSIVLDRQANAAAPAYTDIYESSSPTAFRNKLTVDRFVVLKEFRFALATAGDTNSKFTWFHKFPLGKDSHEKFNGTGATIASIYSNSLFIVYCGTQPTNTSTLNINTRIRFIDN